MLVLIVIPGFILGNSTLILVEIVLTTVVTSVLEIVLMVLVVTSSLHIIIALPVVVIMMRSWP